MKILTMDLDRSAGRDVGREHTKRAVDPLWLRTADHIGSRICRDAIWAGKRCNWIGASMENLDGKWTVVQRVLGSDVYSGTSGVAIALAQLFEATGEGVHRATAEAALAQALSREGDLDMGTDSFYSGKLGLAYAAATLGRAFGEARHLETARRLVRSLIESGPSAHGVDVIAGSAGAIGVLLGLERELEVDGILELALAHGDNLLALGVERDTGLSWDTLPGSSDHLTGFGHGAAGVAFGLIELHARTGETRFGAAAREALRYEQGHFSAENDNWPDFRDHSEMGHTGSEPVYGVAWCAGSSGCGLSRLRAHTWDSEGGYSEQAEAALRSTARTLEPAASKGGDFTLCHGVAGNAELLLYASEVTGDSTWRRQVEKVARIGVEFYASEGIEWPCGILGGQASPNLMLGLAGIVQFFLRLGDAERVESVLHLGAR